jgi:hypothetical protein
VFPCGHTAFLAKVFAYPQHPMCPDEDHARPGGQRSTAVSTVRQGTISGVPTISRFFGIVIAMFFDDHGPPHFHARHADGSAKIRIDPVEVIDSTLGRRQLRLVLAWAELHQEELLENWRLARAGETLNEIEPLR